MNRRDLLRAAGLASTMAALPTSESAAISDSKRPHGANGDLWRWNAVELAAAIRARHISCREATQSCLTRLESVNPKINAVIEVFADEALDAADAADQVLRSGRTVGPLHGVPITTKITTDQRGHATTSGAVAFKNSIATEDGSAVANLRRAGAVFLGRTNAPPFATRWFTDNDLYGQTLNPWDPSVTPGGSSGGAAASIAVGIAPLAQCGDTIGSIRIPAYACGVAGIRPTLGRVPAFNPSGAGRLRGISAQLLPVNGLIARRVKDLRLGLSVISQGDTRDVWWVPVKSFAKPLKPCTVALFDHADEYPIDPAVAAGLRRAATSLTHAGYVVEPVTPPYFAEITSLLFKIFFNDQRDDFLPFIDKFGDAKAKKAMASFWEMTQPLDLSGFSHAIGRREQIQVAWAIFLKKYPLLLMPPCWARQFPQNLDQQGSAAFAEMIKALSPTFIASLLGLPALAVPSGVVDGLPTGVEIVGDRFREDLCFDAGEVIEAEANIATPIEPTRPRSEARSALR